MRAPRPAAVLVQSCYRCAERCSALRLRVCAAFFAAADREAADRDAEAHTPPRAGPLSTSIVFVDSRPRSSLGFLLWNATILLAFRDMIGFAFLFICIL
jgi:hypothetical protein